MKLTEKKASATHRVLVYGGPKVGKTELVGKLSQYYNLHWFDAEKGWVTLTKLPKEWQERINIISIPDSRVFPIAAETWQRVIKGAAIDICGTHGKVSCAICKKEAAALERVCLNELGPRDIVVFDSLTQLSNSFIAHLTKAQPEDYKLHLDDWGNLKVLVEKFLSQVQAANFNIVCITHEEQVPMEDGKMKLVPVSGSSKSSMNTAKYFDHVVYAEVKNKKHVFGSSTGYGMNIVTGSRTDVVMEKADQPSLLDIFTNWKDGFKDVDSTSTNGSSNSSKSGTDNIVGIEVTEAEKVKASIAARQLEVRRQEKLADSRTPGQIALDNLKSKQASLKSWE